MATGTPFPNSTGPASQLTEGIFNNVKNIDLGTTKRSDARGARDGSRARRPRSKLGNGVDIQPNAFHSTRFDSSPSTNTGSVLVLVLRSVA
jgi:hypothetical protein